eukprot:2967156-Rhodomonas_salina.2
MRSEIKHLKPPPPYCLYQERVLLHLILRRVAVPGRSNGWGSKGPFRSSCEHVIADVSTGDCITDA